MRIGTVGSVQVGTSRGGVAYRLAKQAALRGASRAQNVTASAFKSSAGVRGHSQGHGHGHGHGPAFSLGCREGGSKGGSGLNATCVMVHVVRLIDAIRQMQDRDGVIALQL